MRPFVSMPPLHVSMPPSPQTACWPSLIRLPSSVPAAHHAPRRPLRARSRSLSRHARGHADPLLLSSHRSTQTPTVQLGVIPWQPAAAAGLEASGRRSAPGWTVTIAATHPHDGAVQDVAVRHGPVGGVRTVVYGSR